MQNLLGDFLFNNIKTKIPINNLTEIRIRTNKNIIVKDLSRKIEIGVCANQTMIDEIIDKATKFSRYAYEDEFSRGYIYYKGGIRIGIGGLGITKEDKKISYKIIQSLCIRIPHQVLGCSDKLTFLFENFENTLIISPPGCGKTTIIRDIARKLGNIYDVLILDERYEFLGIENTLDIGKMTDCIQGIPKYICYEGAIRALSPEIIVCDEIFGNEDMISIEKIVRSGVKILASMHSDSLDTIKRFFPNIMQYFVDFIVLSSKPKVGSIKSIIRNKICREEK